MWVSPLFILPPWVRTVLFGHPPSLKYRSDHSAARGSPRGNALTFFYHSRNVSPVTATASAESPAVSQKASCASLWR